MTTFSGRTDFAVSARLRRVCRRCCRAQMRKSEPPSAVYNCIQLFAFVNGNPITLLISPVYICLQFVYKRIRNTRHGVDDVSCAHSRAKRVGWHLDRLLTNVNTALTNVNTAHDPEGSDVYMRISRAKRARLRLPGACIRSRLMVRSALLMNGREFALQRMLLRLGLEEAARGVFRDVVKFAVRHSAQISRITNAVTDRDAVILKSNIADPLDPLPSFGTIHSHISSLRCGYGAAPSLTAARSQAVRRLERKASIVLSSAS